MKNECPHPEVRHASVLINKNIKPESNYCLACGEEV